jgi:hypothetical protein
MNLLNWKLIALFFTLLICFAVISTIISEKNEKKKLSGFEVVNSNSTIFGVVCTMDEYRGNTLIELNNRNKYWFKLAENYHYNPSKFYKFIQINDSIIKFSNNDTIFVHRGKNHYFFINHSIIK